MVVLGVTTLLVGRRWRIAGWMTGLGALAVVGGVVLNLPWAMTWSWDDLTAPPLAGPGGRGLVDTAAMAIGDAQFEWLALALYLPVLVALAVSRAWRLTWAARGAGLVVVFLALAVLQDRDALPFAVPDVGLLLVPVALGLALSAASAVAAFGADVTGRTFGWRQPLGLLSIGGDRRRTGTSRVHRARWFVVPAARRCRSSWSRASCQTPARSATSGCCTSAIHG